MTLHPDVKHPYSIEKFKTLEKRFHEIHNFKYNYSEAIYLYNSTKMKIICPIHREFLQSTSTHLKGYGCPKCGGENRKKTKIENNRKEFINKANKIHDFKYNYYKFEYLKGLIKGIIICPIHGEFLQTPNAHLGKQGCPLCARERANKANILKSQKAKEEFKEKANKIHDNFYDYSKFVYIDCKTKGIIICSIHGEFLQGQGCTKCGIIKRDKNNRKKYYNKPTILYYINISKENFPDVWKIGITTKFSILEDGSYDIINTKNGRFCKDIKNGCKIEVLNLEHFKTGKEAYNKEQEIHNKYRKLLYNKKYNKKYLFRGGGDSELFLEDCYKK